MADAWFVNPHNKLATIARQMEVYKRELDACGKPFPAEFPMAREVFIARTRAEAIERARPSLEVKYKAYRDWGQDKVMPSSDHFDLDFDDLVDDRFLIGSPAEVTEQILDLRRRFGVTTLIAGVHWVGMPKSLALEQMQLLAEEVFPAVRQASLERLPAAQAGRGFAAAATAVPVPAVAELGRRQCAAEQEALHLLAALLVQQRLPAARVRRPRH